MCNRSIHDKHVCFRLSRKSIDPDANLTACSCPSRDSRVVKIITLALTIFVMVVVAGAVLAAGATSPESGHGAPISARGSDITLVRLGRPVLFIPRKATILMIKKI